MHTNVTHGIRAATAAHTSQQPAGQGAAAPGHRPGDQVAHYKGATLRTSFAMVRPGGMAKAMLAKLKPRCGPSGGVASAESQALQAAIERDGRRSELMDGGDASTGGQRVHRRDGEQGGQQGSSGDDQPSREEDASPAGTARRRRAIARGPARDVTADRPGAAALLRADWAAAALASGGESALRRALAARLFQVARGPGTVGWRRPWVGQVGAVLAASPHPGADLDERGLGAVRAVLVDLSAAAAGHRLLPNPMRETLFCLLPLVLLDLQRPRTAAQRHDALVRIAALARMPQALSRTLRPLREPER
jgi:hypothetical protein